MALFDRIKESLIRIKADAADIRDAANEKGARILETDNFSEWADRILTNIETQTPAIQLAANGNVEQFSVVQTLRIPTENIDGTPCSTTLNFSSAGFGSLLMGVEEIDIPSYFQAAKITFYGSAAGTRLHKISFGGGSYGQTNAEGAGFDEYDFPNATNIFLSGSSGNSSFFRKASTSGKGIINAPKITSFSGYFGYTNGVMFDVSGSDFTLCESWGPSQYTYRESYLGGWMKGTLEMPALKSGLITAPFADSFTLYTPVYENASNCFRYITNSAGVLHWYIGGNMSTFTTQTANVTTLLNDGLLDIHIPSGNTTTKATLDAAAVPYTQDYNP